MNNKWTGQVTISKAIRLHAPVIIHLSCYISDHSVLTVCVLRYSHCQSNSPVVSLPVYYL